MITLIGKEDEYDDWKKSNEDDSGYGQYIFEHAEQWADLMEFELDRITNWKCKVGFLKQNAQNLSLQTPCCKGGLTGYQHDCAINILITFWKYGFELWLGMLLEKYDDGTDDYYKNAKDGEASHVMKMWIDKKYEDILKYRKEIQKNVQQIK